MYIYICIYNYIYLDIFLDLILQHYLTLVAHVVKNHCHLFNLATTDARHSPTKARRTHKTTLTPKTQAPPSPPTAPHRTAPHRALGAINLCEGARLHACYIHKPDRRRAHASTYTSSHLPQSSPSQRNSFLSTSSAHHVQHSSSNRPSFPSRTSRRLSRHLPPRARSRVR